MILSFIVLLLLSSFIVQLRLSTFNKVYDDDDELFCVIAVIRNSSIFPWNKTLLWISSELFSFTVYHWIQCRELGLSSLFDLIKNVNEKALSTRRRHISVVFI